MRGLSDKLRFVMTVDGVSTDADDPAWFEVESRGLMRPTGLCDHCGVPESECCDCAGDDFDEHMELTAAGELALRLDALVRQQ